MPLISALSATITVRTICQLNTMTLSDQLRAVTVLAACENTVTEQRKLAFLRYPFSTC